MEGKNTEKWITREGAKKQKSQTLTLSNNNNKNKKISRNKSVSIMPSWQRKHHHSITKFIKKSPSPNNSMENISKNVTGRKQSCVNESPSNRIGIIERYHHSEETQIKLETKKELISNEKSITEKFQNNGKEPKMVIEPKPKSVSHLPLCNISNNSNYVKTLCNGEINISHNDKTVQNEKNKDSHLINAQKFDICIDHNINNQQSSLGVLKNIKSEIKYNHKQCFDLNEIFEVPKFPNKVKTLEERLRCIESGDIHFTLKDKNMNDFRVKSLKYGYKPQITGDLNNIFKCPDFKYKTMSVNERLSKIM